MARFASSSALALLVLAAACVGAMPMMPNKGYCETTATGGNAMVITNGMTVGIIMDTTRSSTSACYSTYNYQMDSAAMANVSLVQTSENCYGTNGAVSWFGYDSTTDTITMMAEDANSDDPRKFVLSPASCPATPSTSSTNMNNSAYCTAGATIVTNGQYYMWTQMWGNSVCSQMGTYDVSRSYNNVFNSQTSMSCSGTSWSLNSFWASNAANTMGMQMYSPTRTATFTAEACTTINTASPDVNTAYCVKTAANDRYNGMMIRTDAMGNYWMVGPNALQSGSYSYNVCMRQGMFWSLGNTFAMTVGSSDSCGGYNGLPTFTVGKFFSSNDSLAFANEDGVWFNAPKCEAQLPSLPTGRYCAGENAEMYVGKEVVQVMTDHNQMINRDAIVASYVATQGGIALSSMRSNGSTPSNMQVRVQANGFVSLTWSRGSKVEGYGFSQSFCGNASAGVMPVAPAPVPSNNYCFNDATLSTNNGAWAMYLNQTWVPSYYKQCAIGGIMSHRAGAISYRVDMNDCAYSSWNSVFLSNMTYTGTGITFVLTNGTKSTTNVANTTVTAMPCAAASNTQYFASTTYCSMGTRTASQTYGAPTSMPAVTAFHSGSTLTVIDWEDACIGVSQVSGQSGMMTNLTVPLGGSKCTAKRIQTLANGDLHITVASGLALVTVSSAACGTNFTSPMTLSTGAWCGMTSAAVPPVNASAELRNSAAIAKVAKVSIGVSEYGLMSMFVQPMSGYSSSTNPVRIQGWAWTSPGGAIDYSIASTSSSAWTVPMIMKNADGSLEVTLQYNNDMPVTFTASSTSCTAWGKSGLTSGAYSMANVILGTETVVMGDLMSFIMGWSTTGQMPSVYWVNVSSTANTNVTYSSAWTTSNTWSNTNPTSLSMWINTVGTNGLSFSSKPAGTFAAVLGGNRTALPNWSVMSSAAVPALGGRVFAAINNGTVVFTFPGTAANPQYRCSLSATIARVGDQISIGAVTYNSWSCGSSFLISSATYSETDMSINFKVNFKNTSSTVKLLESQCATSGAGVVGGIPSGIYCDGKGFMRYVCNDLFVDVAAGQVSVMNYGNLTAATNGTTTATLLSSSNFAVATREIVRYEPSTKNMWSADYSGEKLAVRNSGWCMGAANWGDIPLGGFCGASEAQRKVTFMAFDNRIFYLAFPSSGTSMCRMVGDYTWVAGSNEMNFAVTRSTSPCSVGGPSWASAPRLRITKMVYNNKTFAVTIDGYNFTAPNSAGTKVQLTAAAGSCSLLGQETATYKVVSQGIFRTNVGNTMTTMYTVGQQWAVAVNMSGAWSVGVGSYMMYPTDSAKVGRMQLVNQGVDIRYGGSSMTVYNMTQVQLPTMKTGVLTMLINLGSTYLTLAESYMGATPASGGNSAADDKKDAEEKSKTTIIIAIAVAVVVVLAIVAVIVMKSRGGSNPPPTQPEGQDYHPMNAV